LRGGREVFGRKVNGDSMIEAGILSGDYIFVKKQIVAQRGEIVVALIGDEATVKYYFPEKDYVRFQPANKTMAPILVRAVDFRPAMLLGVVVGVFRRVYCHAHPPDSISSRWTLAARAGAALAFPLGSAQPRTRSREFSSASPSRCLIASRRRCTRRLVAFVETKRSLGADEEPYFCTVTIPDDGSAPVSAKDTSLLGQRTLARDPPAEPTARENVERSFGLREAEAGVDRLLAPR